MPVAKGPKGVQQEMHKFKAGALHSGSKKGPVVTNPKQAVAISLNQAGLSKKKKNPMFQPKTKLPGPGGTY